MKRDLKGMEERLEMEERFESVIFSDEKNAFLKASHMVMSNNKYELSLIVKDKNLVTMFS